MTMTKTAQPVQLAPGLYVLDKPVTNPHPDKRQKAWTAAPEFPPGVYRVSVTPAQNIYVRKRWGGTAVIVCHHLAPDDLYNAIAPHLRKIDPRNLGETLFNANGPTPDDVLTLLLNQGKINLSDVAEAGRLANRLDENTFKAIQQRHGMVEVK